MQVLNLIYKMSMKFVIIHQIISLAIFQQQSIQYEKMKKQIMGQERGIEMFQPTNWKNIQYKRQPLDIRQIPRAAFQTVFQLLRQDFSIKVSKKSQQSNPSFFYFNPHTREIGIWNFIIIMTSYFLQFQISLTLAFGPQFWNNEITQYIYFGVYIFLVCLLAIDIFINFHKGYYAFGYGKVIDDYERIIKRYLKFHFGIDLICLILLLIPLFHSSYGVNFIQLIPIILLFIKKFKCQGEIVGSLQYYKNFRNFFIILMLGCDMMQLGNFGACMFLGLDLLLWRLQFFGNNPQYYWLSNDSSYSVDLIDGPWVAQYVYAQSFSTGTLSTLAPGPFGKNPIQISYQLFVMIFFMILASYVGQVLISVLQTDIETRTFHENNIQKFDNFMGLKHVTSSIKQRVQNFFQLIWEFEIKLNSEKERQLIDGMPISLRQELLMQTGFAKEISFINFFRSNSQQIQKIISFKIVSNIVDPDATIFEMGSGVGDGFIYFIKNGLAKFFFPFQQTTNIICLSNQQRLLGQFQFVTGLSFPFCCKSIDLCMIEKISQSDLQGILKALGLQEQLHILKCRILLYNQVYWVGQTCIICDGQHRENCCPQINMKARIKQKLDNQQSYYLFCSREHSRLEYKRKNYRQRNLKRIKRQEINELIADLQRLPALVSAINKGLQIQSDEVRQYWKYYTDFNMY